MISDTPVPAAPLTKALTAPAPAPIPEAQPHLAAPLAVIGLLAIAAFVFARRKKKQAGWIQVLESTSVGPKRSLLVAQVGDETVLLGSSEAGITLLKAGLTRTVPAVATEPSFEDLLTESAEDQALRIKLAAGQQVQVS